MVARAIDEYLHYDKRNAAKEKLYSHLTNIINPHDISLTTIDTYVYRSMETKSLYHHIGR